MSPLVARVPPELYRSIVCHVFDIHTLGALMSVSRSFNDETERILYKTVEYDKEERRWPLLYGPHLPWVAPYVRCISFLGLWVEPEYD